MNIRHMFITIAAVLLTSAALADSSSVTSKKYVDDFMAGYQNKIPGSGADKLMIYDDTDGISAKQIVSSLGDDTGATNIPDVGAVKDALDDKQDTINGTAGYVMTGTGTAGDVGERAIYSTTTRYEDSLVTAESVNSGVINAVNNSLRRVNANGEPDDNGTLWEIADTVVALSYLPAGYTQLEYVNMNLGSYLLTNLVPTYDSKIEIDFQTTTISSLASAYFGCRNVSGGVEGLAMLHKASNNGGFMIFDGFVENGRYTSNYVPVSNTRYKYVYNDSVVSLSVGDTQVVLYTFTPDSTVTSPLVINAFNDNGSVGTNREAIYLYSFKMWNGQGELIANYIPATQTNPSAVGFYDTVSGTFKTATVGTFTAGPAVAGN